MLKVYLPQSTLIMHIKLSKQAVRGMLATIVALMGIINGLTVLLPARLGRLALLEDRLAFLAPFTPSI